MFPESLAAAIDKTLLDFCPCPFNLIEDEDGGIQLQALWCQWISTIASITGWLRRPTVLAEVGCWIQTVQIYRADASFQVA